jgi:hypothetical protein
VFEQILNKMRGKVRRCEYVMTTHARKEMNDDDSTIFDIESGIMTGTILERQKDKVTSEWKYRIRGKTLKNEQIKVIAKISVTGKIVIITVYLV